MRHLNTISRAKAVPGKAENLLVLQQKVIIFDLFVRGLATLADAFATAAGIFLPPDEE